MPGSSRMPVSLRSSFAVKKSGSGGQLLALNIDLLRNVVFFLFVLRWVRKGLLKLKGRGVVGTAVDCYLSLWRTLYGLFLRAPGVRSQVRRQVREVVAKMETKLVPSGPDVTRHLSLPKEGMAKEKLSQEMDKLLAMNHTRWEEGIASGAVYHGGEPLTKLQTEAFGMFTAANPIHPDIFPAVRKMEAEIVAMVLAMFNAPSNAVGVTTSGGTESILMAIYSARQKAYSESRVREPEMILPETAHVAFQKAGTYFGIKIHLVACPPPKYQVHIPSVARLINSNTILLVGSAPNFPHGIMDDISGLSKLALKRRLPLHVDCCLGSFIVPFLEKAGFETEAFDFRLKGVSSISCDTHKYGFAPKGNSVIMYRNPDLRKYQYFIFPDWPGGVYGSPSIAGSRPGALIAACWVSMMNIGENGYINACHEIVSTAKKIAEAIRENTGLSGDLEVIGQPLSSVVAFRSKSLDIYNIADAMAARGWHLNSLQRPPAMHVAVTLPTVKVWEKLVADLEAVVECEKERERVKFVEGKGAKGKVVGDNAALYRLAGSLPNKSVVVELVGSFLDILYKA